MVLSAYMVTAVIAKISLGAIYDRFGLRFWPISLAPLRALSPCVALCFPDDGSPVPIVAAVELWYPERAWHHHAYHRRVKQFGMADLGKVTGTITSLEMVGGTVGAIVSGVLFDATGLCEHLDCVPGVLRGHARVPAGIRAHRRLSCVRAWRGDVRRSFLFARTVRGRRGSRMDARTIIRFLQAATGLNGPYSSVPKGSRDPKGTEEWNWRRRIWPNEPPIPSFGQMRRR